MAKMKVSLIPNDFSQDLETVFQLCQKEGVKYVELATMWNKSILDLDETEKNRVHELMDQYHLKTASIQTQIMKVRPPGTIGAKSNQKMHDDYEYNIAQIDNAIQLAKEFDTKNIVTYSFLNRGHGDTEKYWNLMFETYANFNEKLKAANKCVVIECDGGQYMGTVDDHLRLMQHFNSPHIRVNFDVANLHGMQIEFTHEDFEKLHPYVGYFHCKDRKMVKKLFGKKISTGAIFGTGMIPWRKVLPWFAEVGYDGFLSVEPHVGGKNKFEKGRQCVQNLQKLLRELNIDYE